MKKNFFSSEYLSQNSLVSTLRFIKWFKHELLSELENEFNLLYVDAPKLCKFKDNVSTRMINFDNKATEQIFQIVVHPCKYINNTWQKLNESVSNISGLITKYTLYNRDVTINNCRFIYSDVIDFRIEIDPVERNNFVNLIDRVYQQVFNTIVKIVNNYKKQNSRLVINDAFLSSKYKIKSLKNFAKVYQTLKINDYILQKTLDYKYLMLTNILQTKSQYLNSFSESDDLGYSAQLLWFHEPAEQIVNIVQLALSKKHEFINYLHIVVNLEQLLMIILNKAHIAEVLPGSWGEDLKKEALKKKVNIL